MGFGSRGVVRELDYIVVFLKSSDVFFLGLLMIEDDMVIYN